MAYSSKSRIKLLSLIAWELSWRIASSCPSELDPSAIVVVVCKQGRCQKLVQEPNNTGQPVYIVSMPEGMQGKVSDYPCTLETLKGSWWLRDALLLLFVLLLDTKRPHPVTPETTPPQLLSLLLLLLLLLLLPPPLP